jgi:hypothetical protein
MMSAPCRGSLSPVVVSSGAGSHGSALLFGLLPRMLAATLMDCAPCDVGQYATTSTLITAGI